MIREVLAAYESAARRDPAAMSSAGRSGLAGLDAGRPTLVREHMLVIAELGAFAGGRPAEVAEVEQSLGRDVIVGPHYGLVRSFLLASAALEGDK